MNATFADIHAAADFIGPADAGTPVGMPHLLEAARVEYGKLGKPLSSGEIGGFQ